MAHALARPEDGHARGSLQALPVALGHGFALGDLTVQVAQVAHTHRSAELVHLGVSAHVLHALRARDAEVLPLVEQRVETLVLEADRAALDGVEHLGCVEAEHGGVAEGRGGAPLAVGALPFHAKCVGRIVDDLQAMPVGDFLDGAHIA